MYLPVAPPNQDLHKTNSSKLLSQQEHGQSAIAGGYGTRGQIQEYSTGGSSTNTFSRRKLAVPEHPQSQDPVSTKIRRCIPVSAKNKWDVHLNLPLGQEQYVYYLQKRDILPNCFPLVLQHCNQAHGKTTQHILPYWEKVQFLPLNGSQWAKIWAFG